MRMPIMEWFLNRFVVLALKAACRLDIRGLAAVPHGPAILVTNHTSNIEGPAYYVLLRPRSRTAFGKVELWSNPVTRFMMQVWRVIPITRGRVDSRALKWAESALAAGDILGIAIEGTRSTDGTLQRGRPGAAMLAVAHDVPVIPVVQWGFDRTLSGLLRLKRTTVRIRFGEPFRVPRPKATRPSASELRSITDYIMLRLASLLPVHLRGYYKGREGVGSSPDQQ